MQNALHVSRLGNFQTSPSWNTNLPAIYALDLAILIGTINRVVRLHRIHERLLFSGTTARGFPRVKLNGR